MVRTLLFVALAALTSACGGRASLSEDSGRSFHQVWQAQVEAQPKDKLAPFTAAEAVTVMGNHTARYSKGGVAKPGGGGGGGVGGGVLNPATTDLGSLGLGGGDAGGGGGPGDRKISLEP